MDPDQPTQQVPTSAPMTEPEPSRIDSSRNDSPLAVQVRLANDAPAALGVPWLARDTQLLRWLAGLAVAAVVLAKGVAPALRGYKSGIGGWIAATDAAAALLSQLLVVCAVMLCFRLILATTRERRLPALQRLIVVPAAAGVLTLTIAASKADLTPTLTLALGCASALVALFSGARSIRLPKTRALGLVLGVIGAAAMLQTTVRVIALEASDRALAELFVAARALATLSFVLFVAAVVIVVAWLLAGCKRGSIAAGAVLLVCVLLAWVADLGSRYGASGASYLLGRTLMEMSRQPSPLVAPLVRHWVLLVSLGASLAAVLWPRRDRLVQACLAIVVLTGVDTDVPALGLLLVLTSLSATLASTITGLNGAAGPQTLRSEDMARSGSEASGE
jgi:hypothetical protein